VTKIGEIIKNVFVKISPSIVKKTD